MTYDTWLAQKTGIARKEFTAARLARYQLVRLNELLAFARTHSSFYARRLRGDGLIPLNALADMEKLPFTTPDDLRRAGLTMLCVAQGEISRVVTLETSGTTGLPKKLYFTEQDQELTVDSITQSMSQLVRAAELVYILLPARSANGVGDLLYRALRRLGAWPVKYGTLTDLPAMLDILLTQPVRCLVGVPAQVLALAKYYAAKQETRKVPLKNILLCTDHVPRAIKREIESIWGCPVFDYYGMTEAGYGGGMECPARSGYHLHEADLYFEIVGPVSGRPVPAGQEGEIVLTTLTRRGMPLIRYRTGDISRFVLEPCPCGTAMRRLEKIRGRKNGLAPVGTCGFLAMSDLDEVLFPLPGVVDFTAEIQRLENKTRLTLLVHTLRPGMEEHAVRQALDSLSAVRDALAAQILELAVEFSVVADVFPASSGKRQIIPIPN